MDKSTSRTNSLALTPDVRADLKYILRTTDAEFERLQDVVNNQSQVDIKNEFEIILLQHKTREEARKLAARSSTTTFMPDIGGIFSFFINLKPILEKNGFPAVEFDSSCSSSASSHLPHHQDQEEERFCLVQKIKQNGIDILPIASFNRKVLTTNNPLFGHVLAIDPLPPPPNTETLKVKLLCSISKSLYGYLILLPIFIQSPTSWPSSAVASVDRRLMPYINSELAKRQIGQVIENVTNKSGFPYFLTIAIAS